MSAKSQKTTLQVIEENAGFTNEQIVGEMMFSNVQVENATLTVWEKSAYLFAGHLCESMDDFRTLLTESLDENAISRAPQTNDGKIKFRSWSETKVFWQYASAICKAVEVVGTVEDVFPADNPLPSISDIKKLAYKKKESTAFKKCSQLLATLNNLVDKVSNPQEKQALLTLINEAVAGLQ